jgi:hypothetical protein
MVDIGNNSIFQLHKCGFLKLRTQLLLPNGEYYKLPSTNSVYLPSLGINVVVKEDVFKTTCGITRYFGLALGLSYFWWLRQQIWEQTV